jgi:PAS domain S-box-containing protein
MTILIIYNLEDVYLSSILATVYPLEKYRILKAWTVDQGLAEDTEMIPALVILDGVTAGNSLVSQIVRIRTDERIRTCPILLLIDHGMDEGMLQEAMDAGASEVLHMPIHRIEATLRLRQLRRSYEASRVVQNPEIRTGTEDSSGFNGCSKYALANSGVTTIRGNTQQELSILKHAIDQSPVSMVVTDAQGFIEYVNPKFSAVTGYTAAEAKGQNPRILNSGELPGSIYTDLWNTILSGRSWHGTFHNRKKSGELYWEDAIISPVQDEKGRIHHFFALKEDITVRKAMEERIHLQLQAMDSAPGYILIADATVPDYPIMYANNAFEKLTGYSIKEVLGKNPRFLQRNDHDQEGLQEIRDSLKNRRSTQALIRNYRKDGSPFWNDIRIAPVWNDEGRLTHFIGVCNVVDKLVEVQEKLKENEERLRRAQDYANIGTWDWDIRSGDLFLSEQIAPIFGLAPEAQKTSYRNFLAAVHPEDKETVMEGIRRCILNGDTYQVEHRCILPDGSLRWLQENGNRTLDINGRPSHLLGLAQDITLRKNAETALKRSEEAARKANQAKSEFLSSMSHELRTPLNAILGFGQLLEMDSKLEREHKDYAQEIIKAGHHLLGLIDEVLDLARVESGRINLSIEPVDCASLARECLSLVDPTVAKQGILLQYIGDPGLIASGDRIRIKQVLINLLSNAIKYNRKGGTVDLKISTAGDMILFSVSDTGPGIPEYKMTELFQPFNRLGAENSEIEGTGIGLTISKRLIELMGGTIGARSKPGAGSTFWFELPGYEKGKGTRETTTHRTQNFEKEQPAENNPMCFQVLYIEDNQANLRLMEQIFASQSHLKLRTSHSPSLGLELAAAHRPDLILLDINLPEMDGFEVLRFIRKKEWGKDLPVIAISAEAMPHDLEKGTAAGFEAYLTKPLDILNFLGVVSRCLENHRTTRKEEGIVDGIRHN